jgi:hypothetical protein
MPNPDEDPASGIVDKISFVSSPGASTPSSAPKVIHEPVDTVLKPRCISFGGALLAGLAAIVPPKPPAAFVRFAADRNPAEPIAQLWTV